MTLAFHVPGSTTGWLRQREARWKLAALVPLLVVVALLNRPEAAMAALLGSLALAVSTSIPASRLLARLGPLAGMLLLFFGWLVVWPRAEETPVSWFGLNLSPFHLRGLIVLLCKTLAFVTLITTLLETATMPELGRAAASLGVPKILVHLVVLTERYIFVIADEFSRLRLAVRVRGFRNRADRHSFRTIGHVAGTLFVRGHDRAERVYQAMRCRGFDGTFRTVETSTTSWGDIAMLVGTLVTAGILFAADRGMLSS